MADKKKKTSPPPTKSKAVASKARQHTQRHFGGFSEFLRSQGVVGLAIGFILGTQAKVLVDQFSASFINPILGLVIGGGENLTAQQFSLTVSGSTAVFKYGAFLFVLINFVITAAIIYCTFKWLRLDKLDKKKD